MAHGEQIPAVTKYRLWIACESLVSVENTVKSTLEKKLLTELEKNVDWKNSPK